MSLRPLRAPAAGAACLAGVVTAVVAARHAGVTDRSPLELDGGWLLPWRVGVWGAFAANVVGVLLVRRPTRLAPVLALAAAIQLAPLGAPLLLSADAYAYWDYGRIGAVHDANPYETEPQAFPSDPAFARMGALWHDQVTSYGPLWTGVAEAQAATTGRSAEAAADVYKALAALAMLAVTATAALAARRRAFAAAFTGWNPLLALHFAGGGHNDALMMAGVVGGLALARRGRAQLGGAAWAAATFVKWVPLVLLPLLVLARARGAKGLAAAAAALAAASTAAYGLQWLGAAAPIGSTLDLTSSLSVPFWLQEHVGLGARRWSQLLTALFVPVYAWLLVQAWRGRPRLGLTLGLLLLTVSWLPPWYAGWCIPLAAVEEDRAARVVAVALTAWLLRDAAPL